MSATRVLISGASIAGPALALWLDRYGFEVTIVEKASSVRPGGQTVDFKGRNHRAVLERMGLLDDVLDARVSSTDGTIVDAGGRRLATVPAAFSGGEIEIPRGDLAQLLHGRTADRCEYLFGDSITALEEEPDGVRVTFAHAEPRKFDLVVGADGIHSNVRRLTFGPEEDFVRYLGWYYALADIDVGSEDEMYNEPGRMIITGGGKAPAFFVFASPPLGVERDDIGAQKRALIDAYRGGGWHLPALLERLPDATEFYLDSISRAAVDHYARGRVVLLGDAAYGNTLGGFGTGLAIVGAYVLAGELAAANGDHGAAFPAYEQELRRYARSAKAFNAGRLLAPRTSAGIRLRNALFSVSGLSGGFLAVIDRFATNPDLPDYPVPPGDGP